MTRSWRGRSNIITRPASGGAEKAVNESSTIDAESKLSLHCFNCKICRNGPSDPAFQLRLTF